jgi:hypothetical protein
VQSKPYENISKALQFKLDLQRYRDLYDSLYLPRNLYDLVFDTAKKSPPDAFPKEPLPHRKACGPIRQEYYRDLAQRLDHGSNSPSQPGSLSGGALLSAEQVRRVQELQAHLWHWTDSKLRCHFFCCAVALAYLYLIRLKLHRSRVEYSADHAMDSMRKLARYLCWHGDKRKPVHMIEEPNSEQAQILQALGYKVEGGVLQNL